MNEEKSDSVVETSESKKETINDENSNEEKEKLNKNAEERRICLLNNPNYGVILCFIERFRSHIELQDYSLQQLEENLLSDQENGSLKNFRSKPKILTFRLFSQPSINRFSSKSSQTNFLGQRSETR